MSRAREYLKDLAEEMEVRSIDAHLKSAALCKRAAKLEQLAKLMTDEQAERCLVQLLAEGLAKMVNDRIHIAGDGEGVDADMGITSSGGDA